MFQRVVSKSLQRVSSSSSAARNFHCSSSVLGSSIPVIMVDNVDGTGLSGEIIRVKRGFARNFLIPNKKAAYLTQDNRERYSEIMESRASGTSSSKTVVTRDTVAIKAELAAIVNTGLSMKVKTTDEGVLYGSIQAADIVTLLQENGSISNSKIQAADIIIEGSAIKVAGTHNITCFGETIVLKVESEE
jgi:large subunit ribosomal protein L9